MIIQVSHGPDTVIVTHSINQALSAIRDLINTKPDTLPPLEVDIWGEGVIEESYGFIPVSSEIAKIELYLTHYL